MTNVTATELAELGQIQAATLHEALGRYGALPSGIKGLNPRMKVCGPAYTVKTRPNDNLTLHHALAEAPAGAVLIASTLDFWEAGYWGEVMAVSAVARGLNGLVIDGCVRDADPIEELGFPVFARGLCMRGTVKGGLGELNTPIVIGDVVIQPGDIVVGDRDGVVIVPQGRVAEAIAKSRQREAHEAELMAQLRAGKTTVELLSL
ncbi:MAG: 4-carboxy-4-hydroxy-2-oxoadipate aldolase/oxaloacetate decarboxylase [Anaerolineales bacterium]|nr:4-carboxy-4-hydroxy-2-oxoadipate aldolase/oxaloacetate decarboxylase [Anaerolineales bacterium]